MDDAISAGSAVQAAPADLESCGAIPVALVELQAAIYAPTQCPMCALGAPLTNP